MKAFFFHLSLLILCIFMIFPAFSWGKHNKPYLNDVQKIVQEKLTDDEKKIVDSVFIFYNAKYGYPVKNITAQIAANNMTEEEYDNTVAQAAKTAKNPAAQGLIAAGNAGEKLLKALIIATEDAAKSAGEWIDKKSDEYDKRKK